MCVCVCVRVCVCVCVCVRERERERRPDSVAERLCSKADWEVSGLILATGILSLTGPSPRVLK